MSDNSNLNRAKVAKNDEFYTRYCDIEKEINAYYDYNPDVFRGKTILCPCDDPEWSNFTKFFVNNFRCFGLKKLISTSYAYDSKNTKPGLQTTLFDMLDPNFTPEYKKGKIYTLTDAEEPPQDAEKLKWHYLENDGDFRSAEVTKLRDEADFIITNPPFSLFKEFIKWIVEADKKFAVIGGLNSLHYKKIFFSIMKNKIWLGHNDLKNFYNPDQKSVLVNAVWFTNIDMKKRHEKLILTKYYRSGIYRKYNNYDAINVDKTEDIPMDYNGIMGVPISFMNKYNPEQFEIIGISGDRDFAFNKCYFFIPPAKNKYRFYKSCNLGWRPQNVYMLDKNGKPFMIYQRIFIRKIVSK